MSSESKPIRVQILKLPEREKKVLSNIPWSLSLIEFQQRISDTCGLTPENQKLTFGFPPKQIDTITQSQLSLQQLGIKNGDTVNVELFDEESEHVEMVQGGGWEYPPSIDKGIFIRRVMPADNSCLFHAIAYVCNNKQTGLEAATKMREVIANVVASDPRTYNTVFLGMPNFNYQEAVMNPSVWGGAIDLLVFSSHFQTEIVAFDPLNLREDIFGQGKDYKRRVFLLYTDGASAHYDALVFQSGTSSLSASTSSSSPSSDVVIFSTQDDQAWARARDYVKHLHDEAVRKGECTQQKEWRNNPNLGRSKSKENKNKTNGPTSGIVGTRNNNSNNNNNNNNMSDEAAVAAAIAADFDPIASHNDFWTCSTCTLKNTFPSTTCKACGTSFDAKPSPSSSPSSSSSSSSSFSSSSSSSSPLPTSVSDTPLIPAPSETEFFNCPACTYRNPLTVSSCGVCGAPNPMYNDGVRAPAPQRHSQLIGGFSPPINAPRSLPVLSASASSSSVADFPNEPWVCSKCTFRNEGTSPLCDACRYARPPPPRAAVAATNQNQNRGVLDRMFGGNNSTHPNPWICESCGTANHPQLIRCKNCPQPNNMLLMQQQHYAQDPGCTLQ